MCREGLVPEPVEKAAAAETAAGNPVDAALLAERVARGSVVVPANRHHVSLRPRAVGEGCSIKVNVNIGVSRDAKDYCLEEEKASLAVELGAHALMDLSCHGKTADFRRDLVAESPLMLGSVPLYDVPGLTGKPLMDLTGDDFFTAVEAHARDGIDFLTIHAGLTLKTADRLRKNPRLTRIVSRGGSMLFAWMDHTGLENPYYAQFDRLLEICREHEVTLSLGDGCRPGCLADATDPCQVEELITLGELTLAARKAGVQVMIEGPGHMAMNEIEANVLLEKRLCHGAPFYVLGPLVTDLAPGYDHITAAIGGAVAGRAGADFLCYVTPAEHLRLPDLQDVRDGIIASKIAAHAADISRGLPGARIRDDRMARARADIDWAGMFRESLDPVKAAAFRAGSAPGEADTCTMCGELCAVRTMKKVLT
jgi:phosphomethylpyrimidine synthase